MALPRSSSVKFRLNGADIYFELWWAAVNHDADRSAVRFAPCCNPKEVTKGISIMLLSNSVSHRFPVRTSIRQNPSPMESGLKTT